MITSLESCLEGSFSTAPQSWTHMKVKTLQRGGFGLSSKEGRKPSSELPLPQASADTVSHHSYPTRSSPALQGATINPIFKEKEMEA